MCLKSDITAEDGAASADWVVLTAALVGLTLAVLNVASTGLTDLSNDVGADVARQGVSPTFEQTAYTRTDGFSAYDVAAYDKLVADLRSLNDGDLVVANAVLTATGAAALAGGGTVSSHDQGRQKDVAAALDKVFGERGVIRDTTPGSFDEAEAARIFTALGWPPAPTLN
ncbi:MAG: hypothetical protein AAFY65_08535 [Pseudomonadota bacterium]